MREQWIDQALPEQGPSAEFAARLRDELSETWQHGEAPLARVRPIDRRRDRRRWLMVAASFAAVAAAAAAIVVARDAHDGTTTVPASEPNTAAPTTVTTPPGAPPTTVMQRLATYDALVGHDWVRLPGNDQFPLPAEPRLRFDSDGTVHGTSCGEWTAKVSVVDGIMSPDAPVQTPPCSFDQPSQLDTHVLVTIDGDGIARTTLGSRSTVSSGAAYVAVDTLPAGTKLSGGWQPATGERVTFIDDGAVQIGSCTPAGTWALIGGNLSVTGLADNAAHVTACAGGVTVPGARPLVNILLGGGAGVTVKLDGDLTLVHTSTTDVWLQPATATEPALDLRRGTVYGFAPYADVDSDFVAEQITRSAGQATFDSDWYTMAGIGVTDGTDCLAGLTARVIQWNDLTVGFIQFEGVQRLWTWVLGADATIARGTFRMTALLPTGLSPSTKSVDGLGIGSTVDDLRSAGLPVDNFADDAYQPVTDESLAVRAHVDTANPVELHLDHGTVISMSVQNPGFC